MPFIELEEAVLPPHAVRLKIIAKLTTIFNAFMMSPYNFNILI